MHPMLLEATVRACRDYMEAGDCHGAAPPVECLIHAVVQLTDAMRAADAKLTRIQVGGCTCDTKTPELKYHSERCHFRLASEAAAQLSVAHGVPASQPASDAARLDYLQRTGSTVELLPGFPGDPMQFRIGGLRTAVNADVRAAIDAAIAGVPASVPTERPPLDVDLPERVIDQLVRDSGFTYNSPEEQDVYDLAQVIKQEVLARIPSAWLTPTAGVSELDGHTKRPSHPHDPQSNRSKP